mgnify:CR=1 FL=1
MLKLFGAVLVLFSGTMIGLFQANRFSERPRQIRDLLRALQRLETEIGYGLTPLPDALKKMAQPVQPPTKSIWEELAHRMTEDSGLSAAQIWVQVVEQYWRRTSMKAAEKEVILQLGQNIGISDREDQLKHIQLAKEQLRAEEDEAMQERDRYSKMWKTLGGLAGAFVVILIF